MSQILRDITEISRCSAQYRTDRLAPMGLKACHASYLTEICACPGISQDKLARHIYINKSNVARQAAVLEEEGFITRTPSAADKRVMELYPTDKALALLPQIRDILIQLKKYHLAKAQDAVLHVCFINRLWQIVNQNQAHGYICELIKVMLV